MTELVAGLEVGGGGTAFMMLRHVCELRLKKKKERKEFKE